MELVQSMKLGGGRKGLSIAGGVDSFDRFDWLQWLGRLSDCDQISDQLIAASQHRFFLVQQPRVLYSKKTIASILQLQHHFSNHFALPNLLYRLLGAFKRMHGIDDIVELDPGG